jgi:hypothetical protein
MSKNHIKVIAALFLLMSAVSVDFVSKILSIISDLFFIGIAVRLVLPLLRKGLDDKHE